MALLLRKLKLSDEQAFAEAYALGDDSTHTFALGREKDQSFTGYLRTLENIDAGIDLPEGFVPASYLCGFVNGKIVGRVSFRHKLNDYLAAVGGHIGYVTLPPFRRRGYATAMLRQSLPIARSLGLERVLLTCDDDNIGSIKTIEGCGGVLENVYSGPLSPEKRRRYWISI